MKPTRAQRRARRKGKVLSDLAVSRTTLVRYFVACRHALPFLERASQNLDESVATIVEDMWADGASLGQVGDLLSGLSHFAPWCRKRLPQSWRLFSVWKKQEKPKRAPPLLPEMADAMAERALELSKLALAALCLLGFYGLLRTGELLLLRAQDILAREGELVLFLGETKTGQRLHVDETVVVRHPPTVAVCRTLLDIHHARDSHQFPLWQGSAQSFRNEFYSLLHFFQLHHLPYRPYSLRRGGATHEFRQHGLMEKVLIKGRWSSNVSARTYISEGLAAWAHLRIPPSSSNLISRYAAKLNNCFLLSYLASLPKSRPRFFTLRERGRLLFGSLVLGPFLVFRNALPAR
ncbi:unnamed protein product [Effrenium voratum]|nr:unnamed protein product [Effrenium voratum]